MLWILAAMARLATMDSLFGSKDVNPTHLFHHIFPVASGPKGWFILGDLNQGVATIEDDPYPNVDVSKSRGVYPPKWMVKIMVPTLLNMG